MTPSDPEKEIRAGEEEWEWQDKSSREQQGREGRGNDGDCFNLKVISVSLNALLIFLLGFVWRLSETWLGSLLWQQADTVHRLWSCYPWIMSAHGFSGHRLKRSCKAGAQTGGEARTAERNSTCHWKFPLFINKTLISTLLSSQKHESHFYVNVTAVRELILTRLYQIRSKWILETHFFCNPGLRVQLLLRFLVNFKRHL